MISSQDHILLSGPFPGSSAERKTWRIDCSGRSQVDFIVQRNDRGGESSPRLLAALQTRQKLFAGVVEAEFEYNSIEVLQGRVRELRFTCDRLLWPDDVHITNLDIEGWEYQPALASDSRSTLIVRLREPSHGVLPPLRIKARAAHPDGHGMEVPVDLSCRCCLPGRNVDAPGFAGASPGKLGRRQLSPGPGTDWKQRGASSSLEIGGR